MAPVRAGRELSPEIFSLRVGTIMSSLRDGRYKIGGYPASAIAAAALLSTD